MIQEKIVAKVREYLEKKNIKYITNSLEYLAFKQKGLVRDGTSKSMHLISYDLDFKSDFPIKHTVFIDSESLNLMYIVTPHGYIEIEE